jgi:hypothetical protein
MNTIYQKGYIPKIKYWTEKLLKASNEVEQMRALKKIEYFQSRHKEVYGNVPTIWEMNYGVE